MSTAGLNKEKKKKGFRNGILYGKTKEIDKKIYEDYCKILLDSGAFPKAKMQKLLFIITPENTPASKP